MLKSSITHQIILLKSLKWNWRVCVCVREKRYIDRMKIERKNKKNIDLPIRLIQASHQVIMCQHDTFR